MSSVTVLPTKFIQAAVSGLRSTRQIAQTQLTLGAQCRSLADIDPQDLLLAGCTTITTPALNSQDKLGMGRTLNPNGRSVDVSPYKALRFWAQGDGTPVAFFLETAGITDGDYYQTVITPIAPGGNISSR